MEVILSVHKLNFLSCQGMSDLKTHILSALSCSTIWGTNRQMQHIYPAKTGWGQIWKYWLLYWKLTYFSSQQMITKITFKGDLLFLHESVIGMISEKGAIITSLRTCFDASNLGKAQRVCHSQVPVQWYTAEKGDADVDVGVEDEAEQLAALLTVDPVIVL